MSVPTNRQEAPEPHRDWRGAAEVDAAPSRSLSKIARLWSPIRAILEKPACTLARYAHRLIDRTTGIPYSADELETKILASVTAGPHTHVSADVTDATAEGATNTGKLLKTRNSGLLSELGGVTVGSIVLSNSSAPFTIVRHYSDGRVYCHYGGVTLTSATWGQATGIIPIIASFADSTAANAVVSIGDAWWDTTLNKARVRLT